MSASYNRRILSTPLTPTSGPSPRIRIAAIVALLGLSWLLFPVRIPGDTGASTDECLRLADHPPNAAVSIVVLEQCVKVVPADVELQADLGDVYARAGRDADAERTYRQVLDIDPDYADVQIKLATLLIRRGAGAEARQHAERALSVQPNRQSIRELLADTTPQ